MEEKKKEEKDRRQKKIAKWKGIYSEVCLCVLFKPIDGNKASKSFLIIQTEAGKNNEKKKRTPVFLNND